MTTPTTPTQDVGRRWLTPWTLVMMGTFGAYYAIAQVVLPEQAEQITSSDAAKVTLTAWATGVAAAVTVVVAIAVGVLSDRTTHRRGRRYPWIVGGVAVMAVGVAAQGWATSPVMVVLCWSVVAVGYASAGSAVLAVVPDDVPVTQRAYVSAFYGIALSVGPLVVIALAVAASGSVRLQYAVVAVACVALAVPFALRSRSAALDARERPPRPGVREVLDGLVAPLRHADFAWAWVGRFGIQLSNALAQVYLFFYLKDEVGASDPDTALLVLTVLYALSAAAVAVPAGRWSDRTMRRKRLVVLSSVLQGAAGLVLAFAPTMPAAAVGAVLLGLGYGAYASVDQALVTQVLPSAEHRGKDLGIIGVANVLPYVLAAALGGIVINVWGYPTLYVLVLVTALLAAASVQPIRSVR
ncbi:MFS transporter [Aeromicrobium sp. Leaf350]|uniref:MFS transporter n=1 Tax=Aeromicrobium sp. Leaf350 TaxID=2876565 RepID=UPI001E35399F|nr:MFS transporter [Aeromicrobium sp. Leaf350]